MEILFIIIFVLASQLIHSVAVDQQNGFNPYPFGTTIFCLALHPLLLTLCVWFLGWIWGILIFLCHLFGIVHITVSWLFEIPGLFAKNENQLLSFMKLKIGLLTPVLIITLSFLIISFFVSEFKSLFFALRDDPIYIIVIAIIVILCSVARLIVSKKL